MRKNSHYDEKKSHRSENFSHHGKYSPYVCRNRNSDLEVVSQIHITTSFVSLIGIPERNLQRTEHTVHTISGTDTKQLFPFQYFEEVTVRQAIITCQSEIMNASHPLSEFHGCNHDRIVHQFHIGHTGKRQLLWNVESVYFAANGILQGIGDVFPIRTRP